MIFEPLNVSGAWLVSQERFEDERGYFARTWCSEEFAAQGLEAELVQCSVSFNRQRGTLRGMHFQHSPFGEVKLVRCTRGAVFDVIVDVRRGSSTFLQYAGVELTEQNGRALYIPKGFAHGFLTLEDDSEVFYQMSNVYEPSAAAGFRYDDPAFAIRWPAKVVVVKDRDAEYADFSIDAAYDDTSTAR